MADVISSGPDRAPSPERLGPWPAPSRWRPPAWLVVVALAVGLTAGVRLFGGLPDRGSAAPTATPRPLAGPPARFTLDAPAGPVPAGLRLLIGGRKPSTVDVGAGVVRPLPGSTATGAQSVNVVRSGSTTVVVLRAGSVSPPVAAYAYPDGGRRVSFGPGLDTVVAADGAGYAAAALSGAQIRTNLVGLDAAGRVRWHSSVPGTAQVLQAAGDEVLLFVLPNTVTAEGSVLLLDGPTLEVRRTFPSVGLVLASTDQRVAWLPFACEPTCSVSVGELSSGTVRSFPVPPGPRPIGAAFEPGGQHLALSFAGIDENPLAPTVTELSGYVGVLDLSTGRLARMPDLTTPADQAATLAWMAGDLLAGVADRRVGDRVLVWRLRDEGPTVLPLTLPLYSASSYLAVLP